MPEYSAIYETAIDRIKSVYSTCSASEQKLLLQILQEMSDKGYSVTLENVWLADFKEVPVGIDQFICDPYYMGQVNRNGDAIYPYWRQFFRNIFNAGNKYNAIVLTGSTRVGKTSSSIVVAAYMLYKLMLYRDPHKYFQKKEVSRFTIAFANLTKELAMSVAYREFNDTLRECPWFMDRGSVSASDRNFYYIPEGNKIEIIPASDSAMLLGKQLWCLVGETRIMTSEGTKQIQELDGQTLNILQYVSHQKNCQYVQASVMLTKYATETVVIELEDGSIIEGSPEHLIMLSTGEYKRLDELTEDDDILEVDEYAKFKC